MFILNQPTFSIVSQLAKWPVIINNNWLHIFIRMKSGKIDMYWKKLLNFFKRKVENVLKGKAMTCEFFEKSLQLVIWLVMVFLVSMVSIEYEISKLVSTQVQEILNCFNCLQYWIVFSIWSMNNFLISFLNLNLKFESFLMDPWRFSKVLNTFIQK